MRDRGGPGLGDRGEHPLQRAARLRVSTERCRWKPGRGRDPAAPARPAAPGSSTCTRSRRLGDPAPHVGDVVAQPLGERLGELAAGAVVGEHPVAAGPLDGGGQRPRAGDLDLERPGVALACAPRRRRGPGPAATARAAGRGRARRSAASRRAGGRRRGRPSLRARDRSCRVRAAAPAGPGPRRRRGRRRATPAVARRRSPARGRWPPLSSGPAATGCSPPTAPAASSPRRSPRGWRPRRRRPAADPRRAVPRAGRRAGAPRPCSRAGSDGVCRFHRHRSVHPQAAPGAGVGLRRRSVQPTQCHAGRALLRPRRTCGAAAGAGAAGVSVDLECLPSPRSTTWPASSSRAAGAPRGGADRRPGPSAVGHRGDRAGAAAARDARPDPEVARPLVVTPSVRAGRRRARLGPPRLSLCGRSPPTCVPEPRLTTSSRHPFFHRRLRLLESGRARVSPRRRPRAPRRSRPARAWR